MIHTVRIRGFKGFGREVEFRLPGHLVLAGPNNTGKTSVLQAIASWSLGLRRWRELNDFNRRRGYTFAPITRQAFTAVPLRSFDLLWTNRLYLRKRPIEIELRHSDGWSITMELVADSTEQIYVRPASDAPQNLLQSLDLSVVFVPPMTGIGIDEPVFQPPKIEQLLGLGRPGEVLRNLLVEANRDEVAWKSLQDSIGKLFGYELRPPESSGAHIVANYTESDRSVARPILDIASAGSGFQQVLMLLALLNTRPESVLLLDEPDAHLHVILQDVINHELRSAAARQRSQLVVATHSEVVINSVEPRELYVVTPNELRAIADNAERNRLISALRVVSNTDLMQAMNVRGALYVEDYTDINILRAWATQLGHPAENLLKTELMWKPIIFQTRKGGADSTGIRAREHFEALQLARSDLSGLELVDGDAHPEMKDSVITGSGLQRLRWRRYEIESYLLHPDALGRFVEVQAGIEAASLHVEDMLAHWRDHFPPAVVREPLGNHPYLSVTKARTQLLPPLLEAAGIHDLPYTRYHEIAALMVPEEIHPEVVEKLDLICQAFGIEP